MLDPPITAKDVGKEFLTRDGNSMRVVNYVVGARYPVRCNNGYSYTPNGRNIPQLEKFCDLISRVPEPNNMSNKMVVEDQRKATATVAIAFEDIDRGQAFYPEGLSHMVWVKARHDIALVLSGAEPGTFQNVLPSRTCCLIPDLKVRIILEDA